MFHIIRASFNQRRKTLANGLSNAPQVHLSKEEIQECIAELGEPLTIRGEALTLEQFAALSNIIGNRQKNKAKLRRRLWTKSEHEQWTTDLRGSAV